MKNNICCVFNLAPHYRSSIYKLMNKELDCDFYFGNKVESSIKLLDYSELNGFKKEVENIRILNTSFKWQKNVVGLVFKKKYKYFILTGDASILSNWMIAFFGLCLNKKVYLWMHGLTKELSWKGKLITFPLYHMSSKFLLYSDYSKNLMLKNGFNPNKMVCIYNSLDYDSQLALRKKLKKSSIYSDYFKNNFSTLIYIGRIQKSKKIHFLIDALSILRSKNIFCNLVIVGSDTENVELEKNISKRALENFVWMFGPCYEEEKIAELLYNADVCVSPGNIGLTAIHSMSYGTPTITHGNFQNQGPEFESIVSGVTGDFFEENNIEDLSVKIQKWINLDKDKREKIRLSTYNVIDNRYNPYYQVKILKDIIEADN
jgi:glycosyltransferase involved in cell wall biosynthesis